MDLVHPNMVLVFLPAAAKENASVKSRREWASSEDSIYTPLRPEGGVPDEDPKTSLQLVLCGPGLQE